MSARGKGRRTLNKAKEYYEGQGYLVDEVELGGRFRKSKDLFSSETFGGFDLVAIKQGLVLFIQVKTNTPATQRPYKEFARKYCGRSVRVEGYTHYDRRGPVIHHFNKNGTVTKKDLRKK
jgi:hypothetical protein